MRSNKDSSSQVHVSAMLLLHVIGNGKLCFGFSLYLHNAHTKFYQNPSSGYRIEKYGQTRLDLSAFISCSWR
jgi:hypothetical protein